MKCQSCGSENTEGKKFCSQCGASLTPPQLKQFCTNCGKEIVPGKKFCGSCGTKISDSPTNKAISEVQETSETSKSQIVVHHEEKKGHMGLFILLIVLSVVLAGGGGFCIYRFIIAPSGSASISSHITDITDENEEGEEEDDEVSEENEETDSNLTESFAKEADSNWGGLLQENTSGQGTETYLSVETQPAYETQYRNQGAQYGAAQGVMGTADYILPDSGSRYLTIEDIVSISKEQLRIARNEIYARHGRIFKTEDLNAYFMSKSWYTGTIASENFSEELLNVYEKYNVIFIQEQEDKMN
nr:YARHG domain-containing protein [uncultured Clostridium sp.]